MIQMLVNDGLVIRDPRETLRGFRYVVLTDTKMMKPPVGCEPSTKTPTMMLEPTVTGPICSILIGQFVFVEG